jgi:transposase
MPRPYSDDLRERTIEEVGSGASRREVAEHFDVSPSSVINWLRRWRETGSAAAKPSGGSVSRLEKHAKWFLNLIAARPDLTLDEVVVAKNAAGIPGSRSAVGRFFLRHNISFKKASTLPSNSERTWPVRADAGFESRACLSMRRPPAPIWCGCEVAARAACDW